MADTACGNHAGWTSSLLPNSDLPRPTGGARNSGSTAVSFHDSLASRANPNPEGERP